MSIEIKEILKLHSLWLTSDKKEGKKADLGGANLSGADLSEADLWGADLSEADLWGANLWRANLRRANLRRADLSGANLSGANLCGADLSGANLSGANLCGADLWGANLSGADLSEANLRRANLSGADLSGANLSGADLWGVKYFNYMMLPGKYTLLGFITKKEIWLQIGCITKKISDWKNEYKEIAEHEKYTQEEVEKDYSCVLLIKEYLERSCEKVRKKNEKIQG